MDINGLPMVMSGLYTYGININHEELVPDVAAPHGEELVGNVFELIVWS